MVKDNDVIIKIFKILKKKKNLDNMNLTLFKLRRMMDPMLQTDFYCYWLAENYGLILRTQRWMTQWGYNSLQPYLSYFSANHATDPNCKQNYNHTKLGELIPSCDNPALPDTTSEEVFKVAKEHLFDKPCDDTSNDEPLTRRPTVCWDRRIRALHWYSSEKYKRK